MRTWVSPGVGLCALLSLGRSPLGCVLSVDADSRLECMWWEGMGVLTVLVYDDEGRAEELVLRCLVPLCYAGVEDFVQPLHPEV